MTKKKVLVCKDCRREGISTIRPAAFPGPRCATHWRIEQRRVKKANHERMVKNNYGLSDGDYDLLYESQSGRCYICRISTGSVRALAVEHDHRCDQGHDPKRGCRKCVRCLACKRCNRLIAFLGPEALQRAIEVLTNPPAQHVLASVNTPPTS